MSVFLINVTEIPMETQLLQLLMKSAYPQTYHTLLDCRQLGPSYWNTRKQVNITLILESTDFILKKKLLSLTMNTFYSSRVLQNTTFAPTYANLSTGYHEIKLNDLIEWNNSLDIRQYFAENWKKILDDCEILLIRDFIKPDDLLTVLNS